MLALALKKHDHPSHGHILSSQVVDVNFHGDIVIFVSLIDNDQAWEWIVMKKTENILQGDTQVNFETKTPILSILVHTDQ